jgi:hypothetical protein
MVRGLPSPQHLANTPHPQSLRAGRFHRRRRLGFARPAAESELRAPEGASDGARNSFRSGSCGGGFVFGGNDAVPPLTQPLPSGERSRSFRRRRQDRRTTFPSPPRGEGQGEGRRSSVHALRTTQKSRSVLECGGCDAAFRGLLVFVRCGGRRKRCRRGRLAPCPCATALQNAAATLRRGRRQGSPIPPWRLAPSSPIRDMTS